MARKRGRPCTYTQEIAEQICQRLAGGESLLEICAGDAMPPESTVRGWVVDDVEGFAAKYTRARDIGLDHEADEIKALADNCRTGQKTKVTGCVECSGSGQCKDCKGDGEVGDDIPCPGCKGRGECAKCGGRGGILETVTADMVERTKLQIDARKWRLSKMAPKRYGDRLNLEASGPDGGPIPITVRYVKPSAD